jgi:hypothetical protein
MIREDVLDKIALNPFSSSPQHEVTIWLSRFFNSITLYRDEFENTDASNEEIIAGMTPEFQRSNSKWSEEMQVSYIENVISGYRGELLLYYVDSQDGGFCYILDGLQRITAIKDFIDGNIKVFGGYTFDKLKEMKIGIKKGCMTLKVYTFPNHKAACLHYIAMNKNITHSPEDLIPAYEFMAT